MISKVDACQQLDQHRAEQALTLPLSNVADIAGVEHLGGAEVALDEVEGFGLGARVLDGGLSLTFLAPALQAMGSHQSPHPAPSALDPSMTQSLCPRGSRRCRRTRHGLGRRTERTLAAGQPKMVYGPANFRAGRIPSGLA